ECVNDTYVRAWNCMPPERPNKLGMFLGRITRNLALDRYDARRAHKRNGNMELALDELGECISDSADMPVSDEIVLKNAIDGFLEGLGRTARIVFMRRYWYLCSVSDIARSLGMSESNVKVTLMRTRRKFAEHLAKEGISI
ncbi:MAG: sigma-70 family RNA polymerase sigma factor, partial [Clostridia bacterium]|nr:sigma-70 family RNA polymerase sigma factor [Clostridia bacterium]